MPDPLLDCAAAMRLLWDYLDGELTAEREAQVRDHLAVCARCYPHYEFEKLFLDALAETRSVAGVGAPAELRPKVLAALRSAGL
ncbi:MAG TPA: zf-HC2 domain-containing protein [Gemmatimonadaceae bacterium]|nr:zf-HC2 domain-containing protein [Gemmatimonadaceae bacterium]